MFDSLGWRVYRIPETATMLFSAGVSFPDLNDEMQYSFQKSILSCMLKVEDSFVELAKINSKNGIKTVLICDRGAMDPSAYMPRKLWLKMLDDLGLVEQKLRDHRYDAVIHLTTAAKGTEAFYTLENNSTRTEGLQLACEVDDLVMNAWLGHSSFQVIDNNSCSDFNDKCNQVVQALSTRLGLKADRFGADIKKRKYLVKNQDVSVIPVPTKEFIVEHHYLVNASENEQTRIRKRKESGTNTALYTITRRYPTIGQQKRFEKRRNITPREFEDLLSQADPTRVPIIKQRRCFLYKDNYFQLDVFQSACRGLVLLEAYVNEMDNRVALPDWLDLVEVTDQSEYSMFNLSVAKK
jgi:CYTH domain-containing protein